MKLHGQKLKMTLGALMLSAALVLAGCGGGTTGSQSGSGSTAPSTNEKIVVSAAASLQEAVDELRQQYIAEHHLANDQISVTYGGSGTLRQQIEQGAPSSIFISASQAHMKTLQDKGFMTDVKPLVKNSLVLIVPKGKTEYNLTNLTQVTRLALGEPATVPAGKYGKDSLEYLKLWTALEPKIVYAKDVRSVLAYVSQGAVDAGMVYKTDALQGKDQVTITATVPEDAHAPITYPIGIIKKNENKLTKDFYDYLSSDKGKQILEKYGFVVQ